MGKYRATASADLDSRGAGATLLNCRARWPARETMRLVARYTLEGGQLSMFNRQGQELMVFTVDSMRADSD